MTASKVDALTSHPFIVKSEGQYLTAKKANLQPVIAIILADFPKNHSCCSRWKPGMS